MTSSIPGRRPGSADRPPLGPAAASGGFAASLPVGFEDGAAGVVRAASTGDPAASRDRPPAHSPTPHGDGLTDNPGLADRHSSRAGPTAPFPDCPGRDASPPPPVPTGCPRATPAAAGPPPAAESPRGSVPPTPDGAARRGRSAAIPSSCAD